MNQNIKSLQDYKIFITISKINTILELINHQLFGRLVTSNYKLQLNYENEFYNIFLI